MIVRKRWAMAALAVCLLAGQPGSHAQEKATKAIDSSELVMARKAMHAEPQNLDKHDAYFKAWYKLMWEYKIEMPEEQLAQEYNALMKQHPSSYIIPYAMGRAMERKESPKAKPWLEKALRLNPSYSPTYMALWGDAQRWGKFDEGQQYLEKAAMADTVSPEIAFYYANSFESRDKEKYRRLIFDVVKRFPDHERGAQALYWFAYDSKDPKEKLATWELLVKQYPPDKFDWSAYGAGNYLDYLLVDNPAKAVQLAQSILQKSTEEKLKGEWAKHLVVAEQVMEGKRLMAANRHKDALKVLNEVKLSKYADTREVVMILKAEALAGAGNNSAAYDSLAAMYAKEPTDKLWEALKKQGGTLAKQPQAILADVKQLRYATAKAATPFTLQAYKNTGAVSLSDFKGKVVLLTYWFPGCGPCRREFPHFENSIAGFKGSDFVYAGINIAPEQDEYVLPFLRNSGYSFIPLREVKGRNKGNLENRGIAPMNFIIDKEGNIIYSAFMIGGHNEDMLRRMIAELM